MKWGIIGALMQEIQIIVKEMENVAVARHYDCNFYDGTICGVRVAVAECGVGKIRAALAAHIMIHEYGADRIINTGVAGGVGKDLKSCDTVVSGEVIFHDVDETYNMAYPYKCRFEADGELISLAVKSIEEITGRDAVVGRVATGDVFVDDPEVKGRIVKAVDPMCVEMEGAAIGQTAYMNGVPFVVIRSISDNAGDSAMADFEKHLERAAAVSSDIVIKMIGQSGVGKG